ncbi:MAG: DMT family transporter [Parvularculaceae bacterium]|nr:DMT family transporter [Parvularculaceae bacterium]
MIAPTERRKPRFAVSTLNPGVDLAARELIVLLTLCVCWGFHFVVVKTAVGEMPPTFYAAIRMAVVAIVLSPFLRWRPGKMKMLFLAALCFGCINYLLLLNGVKLATASSSAIANQLYVPFATVLSVLFLQEKIGWRRIAGVSLAFAGVALIALNRDQGAAGVQIGVGVGLVAGAALVEATGSILVKKASGFKPWELLAWFGLVGAPVLMAASAIFERDQMSALAGADKKIVIGAVLYSALVASVFGHTAYYWLIQRRPVSEIAPSSLLTTMFGVAFSVALLDEPFTIVFFIGGLMTLAGVGIVVLRTPAAAPEPGAPESFIPAPEEEAKP